MSGMRIVGESSSCVADMQTQRVPLGRTNPPCRGRGGRTQEPARREGKESPRSRASVRFP